MHHVIPTLYIYTHVPEGTIVCTEAIDAQCVHRVVLVGHHNTDLWRKHSHLGSDCDLLSGDSLTSTVHSKYSHKVFSVALQIRQRGRDWVTRMRVSDGDLLSQAVVGHL